MKKLFSITVALLFFNAATAQDEELYPSVNHQVSINATVFIKQFLTLSNNVTAINSPYFVTYKNLKNGKGFRAGIGGNFNTRKDNPNNGITYSTSQTVAVNLRVGVEKQERLNERWLFYYGLDALYNYNLSRTKSTSVGGFPPKPNEIISDNESFSAGAGPVLGVEFKLGKRISLNTETTAYLTAGENRRRITNPNFPNFDTNEYTSTGNLNIIIPTSIFFVLHF